MKILVANRSEIAVRIIKTIRKMGLESVSIYTKCDEDSLHVKLADYSVCIGTINEPMAYINVERIMTVACELGIDAIHPGYGFLSEQTHFAKMCEEVGIKFIGPSSDIIELMGDKINAINTMKKVGVPTVPGVSEPISDLEQLLCNSKQIGYPVILKAANGGGGKGLRIVRKESDLENSFLLIKREMNDNNVRVFVEKYFENAKHIEVQIVGDMYNNVVHYYNRDCSMQRNNQKIIEEAPALIEKSVSEQMYEVCIKAAKEIGYVGAGTFEFLVENNKYYFLEMNTRIQVEHPISEMITSRDILMEQISVCLGNKLSVTQDEIKCLGHSIEIRVNAENPFKNFMPTPGKITELHLPSDHGVRCDFGVFIPSSVKPFYDSMLGKIIVHDESRSKAIFKLNNSIDEFHIKGVSTTVEFQKLLLKEVEFVDYSYKTNFIAKNYERIIDNA